MRTFSFDDGTSDKFWNAWREGATVYTAFGKAGTKGQTRLKQCPNDAAAEAELAKIVQKKLGEGYRETTPSSAPPAQDVAPLRRSLEDALAENPDDLAAHSAYADYLMEQDDPRGEFVQTQLALERAPAKQQARLRQREADLSARHAAAWVGDCGRFLVGGWSGPDKPWEYRFARGWLDSVRLLPFPAAVTAALANSPEARLLRKLQIVYDMRCHPFEFGDALDGPNAALRAGESRSEAWDDAPVLPLLMASPYLGNLRSFDYGFSDYHNPPYHSTMVGLFGDCTGARLLQLVAKWPRLEELRLNTPVADAERLFSSPALGKLRVLQYYFGSPDHPGAPAVRPLAALAANASLGRLTTLRLYGGRDSVLTLEDLDALLRSPHLTSLAHLKYGLTTYRDEGARRLAASGALRRLKELDLSGGNMTDAGARMLAASGDLRYVERLDVSRNALTSAGIAELRAAGGRVVADAQHGGDEGYLYEVDVE